ncbi:MAG: exodeoxyribonuclease VII small subunit [Phycisphaerales bacterium]
MARKPSKTTPTPDADLSYEQAVERLELLVERIESGEIGLEESIAAYEQGAKLIARCRAILDVAEARIEELSVEQIESGEVGGGAVDRADEGP